ncbi:RNA 2',3'-cyclic phosphodiesterase [uncultured archaeon]|nr:RNA 2',3'-cyclic phosphodiesterase [uncultured archaeon]
MARVFIALDLPYEIISEIEKIQKTIWKKTLFTGKLTESMNLHLTLKFLGEIPDEKVEEVKKRLADIKLSSFECELGDAGVFSRDFIKIIWVELRGRGVFLLQKEIDQKLKDIFEPEERFMSHITIARVKNVRDKKGLLEYLESVKPRKIRFIVDKFVLKKSELLPEGPTYTDLEEYNLIK